MGSTVIIPIHHVAHVMLNKAVNSSHNKYISLLMQYLNIPFITFDVIVLPPDQPSAAPQPYAIKGVFPCSCSAVC